MKIYISNSSCSSVFIYLLSACIAMDVCDEFIDVHNVIEELNLLTSLVDQCEKCKFAYLVLNKEDIAKIFIKKLYVFYWSKFFLCDRSLSHFVKV